MVSMEHNREAVFEKLQLLRSLTNSHAQSKNSIITDAAKYIDELKQKVDRMNQDIAMAQSSTAQFPLPVLRVEAKEKGLLIRVFSERSYPGLLVLILEEFEELGLDVLQARVSCSGSFHLEAIGSIDNKKADQNDAQVVKQALLQAIQNWSAVNEQEY